MKNLKFVIFALVHLVVLANAAQARYDPNIGRWLSRDPIAERGGVNLYGMCENNPILEFDINGKSPRFPNELSQPIDFETGKADPSFNKAMEEFKNELEQDKLRKAKAATHTCCSAQLGIEVRGDKLIGPAFVCVLAFMRFSINGFVVTSQQTIMADLEALPATALQKVADFVHQMRDKAAADRQAAFDASFGCMTAAEAEAFERVIEEGCERIEP